MCCVVRFNTLDQFADASQLLLIDRSNHLGVFAHLLLQEAQKSKHDRIAIVFCCPASSCSFCGEQDLTVG